MKNIFLLSVLVVFIMVFFSCQSSSAAKANVSEPAVSLPSFYIKADGNDDNTGLTETEAFRTLTKAVYSAAAGSVKTTQTRTNRFISKPLFTDNSTQSSVV